MRLVIVESPKKARTIKGFLGAGFQVAASMGHVRDLPPKSLGVDVQREFAPEYVVLPRAQTALTSLRKAARAAESVLLATDPDREGEAIAWHLAEALRLPKSRYRRIAFHEISRRAIQAALAQPRDLDSHLIDAQQARRVLDRLVGYQLSPLLWRKVQRGTSAGRVQSVAVKLVVDREREIIAFVPEEYWTIDVRLSPAESVDGEAPSPVAAPVPEDRQSFLARLMEVDGKKAGIPNGEVAGELESLLRRAEYHVRETGQKMVTRNPFPPFTTSTLQQAAGNRLRLATKRTMAGAQALYEAGLVTYMRTDSVAVSPDAVAQTRQLITTQFGPEYVSPTPRHYATKTKNAQEAHEAIRPVDVAKLPAALRTSLPPDEWRIYELIWQRMVASQMASARYLQDLAWIDAVPAAPTVGAVREPPLPGGRDENILSEQNDLSPSQAHRFALKAQATTLVFDGWLAVYGEPAAERAGRNAAASRRAPAGGGTRGASAVGAAAAAGEAGAAADDPAEAPSNDRLPELRAGQPLDLEDVLPAQHFTQPPRRYTEASLVKALEEAGVGRPSTYATVVSTIQDRDYVRLEQRHFVPSELGFAANDFLVAHFPKIVDLPFTAEMEDSLDEIAGGRLQWTQMLHRFYGPFADTVTQARTAPISPLKRQEPPSFVSDAPAPGGTVTGPTRGPDPRLDASAPFGTVTAPSVRPEPPGKPVPTGAPRPTRRAARTVSTSSSDATCPERGKSLVERRSQFGPFWGCSGFPVCRYVRRDDQAPLLARGRGRAGGRAIPGTRRAGRPGSSGGRSRAGAVRPPEVLAERALSASKVRRPPKRDLGRPPDPLTKRVVRAARPGGRRSSSNGTARGEHEAL